MSAIGMIALLAGGVAGCTAHYQGRIDQARAVGHAEGFVEGLALGITVSQSAPNKNTRL